MAEDGQCQSASGVVYGLADPGGNLSFFADEVVWSLFSSGKFSLSLAFKEIGQGRSSSFALSHIWHCRIPTKVSFFMLRLLLEQLPIPDVFGKMGFHMPSKCFCCYNGANEKLEHLFSEEQIAMEVWTYFTGLSGLQTIMSTLRARVVAWWMVGPRAEKRRILFRILSCYICWHIWKARNQAVFERSRMCAVTIRQAIMSDVVAELKIQFNHVSPAV
ncbi:uncharacterized protein [Coffea arabica]|uniref:Reverse transcriptase zinc-binding domain-containing protein n=1 Tax=Coffea arabica TaxID=13443 RepID=A0ABM4VMD2_COFAR